jgi:hypothetical protein
MIVCPVLGGGGKRFFPDGVCMTLELVEEWRFRSGVLVLRYAVRGTWRPGSTNGAIGFELHNRRFDKRLPGLVAPADKI